MKYIWTDFIPFYGMKFFKRYFTTIEKPTYSDVKKFDNMFHYHIMVNSLTCMFIFWLIIKLS